MTWPTGSIGTTNVDAGTDSPATARGDIKSLVDAVNLIIANGDPMPQLVAAYGRNRIINGDFRVNQRGSSVASPSNSGNYDDTPNFGAADRWLLACTGSTGGAFTQSLSTVSYGSILRTSLRQTVTTAYSGSTASREHWGGIQQRIEGYNCADLAGKRATLSFIFNSNVSGTFPVALFVGALSGSGSSFVTTITATANVPQRVVVSVPTIPSLPSGSQLALTLVVGGINTASYQISAGNLGVWGPNPNFTAPGCTNWGVSVGYFIEVAEVQLEEGTVATAFERRPFAAEVLACQRYFYRSGGTYAYQHHGAGLQNGSTLSDITMTLPCPMRASPTMTVTGLTSLVVSDGATSYVPSAASLADPPSIYSTTGLVRCTVAGAVAGRAVRLYSNNSTSAYLDFSSEL